MIFAVLVPLILSLVFSLVFGSLFSQKPKLGIVDEGSSRLSSLAIELGSVAVKTYSSAAELKGAVEAGAVDMGVVLPQGFDDSVAQDQMPGMTAYIWGESLAKNRMILGATLAHLVVQLAGREPAIDVVATAVGEADDISWDERLLPMVVLLAVFFGGSLVPATSLVEEKQRRTLIALTVTPTKLEEVLLAKGVVGVAISLLMGVLILVLNGALGDQPQLLVLVLALGAIMATGFALLLGLLSQDITSLFATNKALGLLLYAPALIYLFPDVPSWIGKIFPTYYVVQPIVEISLHGGGGADVAFEIGVLLGLIGLLLGAVLVAARRLAGRVA
jgi:ABC-2 type transport system permease protein